MVYLIVLQNVPLLWCYCIKNPSSDKENIVQNNSVIDVT